ncbi:ABC transporter substrate-binding protein [Alkalilacustris brevis]|uniref:ABC transporter substrate-binding protein n=1 Tax=Alkalilacustris brevis TaxID=2026338 RepID=UPI000E0DD889|nr:ABC transporter substrate-binding protein [Alkalilacustris brevis]
MRARAGIAAATGARHWLGGLLLAPWLACAALAGARDAPPQRVVSLNVCTDQLAMLLAAPGQLVAVSRLARDPHASAMSVEAEGYATTPGGAEDVFRLNPDLVLAGSYTTHHATAMLRRLGVPVAEFTPTRDFDGIRADILRVGALLGREDAAEAILAAFDAELAALRADAPDDPPRAVLYSANSWSSGEATLAGAILRSAGFVNAAAEAGLAYGGTLPLEQLIMLAPDAVITGTRYGGSSRAEAVLDHPALRSFTDTRALLPLSDADWVCGTPYVLRAIARLRAAREALP